MERKIIQIAAVPATADYTPSLFALCDDGSLFVAYNIEPGDKQSVWNELPNVPQPTEG